MTRLNEIETLNLSWLSEAAKPQIEMRRQVAQNQDAVDHFKQISTRTVGKEKFDGLRVALTNIDNALQQHNDLLGQYLLQSILLDMINQETGQRGYLLSGEQATLVPYLQGQADFDRHVVELKAHWDGVSYQASVLRGSLDQAIMMAKEWRAQAAEPEINARRAMNKSNVSMDDITRLIDAGAGKRNMDAIRSKMKAFIGEEAGLAIERTKQADDIASTTIIMAIASALLSALVVGLLSFFIIRSILIQIGGEPDFMANITQRVAEGDLTVELSNNGKETGIYNAMGTMVIRLRSMMGQISKAAEQQASATEELAAISEQTSQNVQSQYDILDQTSVSFEQMQNTSIEMANRTSDVAASAEIARDLVNTGNKKAEDAAVGIQALSANINEVAGTIDDLNASVIDISNILDVIKKIADQTNLLALNAAIEAARAGEQGRGFAVVADEVRALAKSTQDSTTEIEQMIRKVQEGAKASVISMDSGRKQAVEIVKQTVDVKSVLLEIKEAISTINDMTIQIASAAEEQSLTTTDVTKRSEEMLEISKQTGAGSQQISSSAEALSMLAGKLNEEVAQFSM